MRPPLKILKICTSRSWGGMELQMTLLCEKFRAQGIQVIPVGFSGSRIFQRLTAAGFKPWALNLRSYLHPLGILRLARLIARERPDLIQADFSRDLWTIVPAIKLSHAVPLILIKHVGTMKPKTDPLHRWLYRSVDYMVAISRVIQENIIRTHPIAAERVIIIHHGVDLKRFQYAEATRSKIRQAFGIRPDDVLIGIVGRLQYAKGYLEFLQMARQIVDRFQGVKFMLVGEATRGEEAEAKHILAQVTALHLNQYVRSTGFRSDVPDLLSALDLFVFPSHAEAFGLVLIEAMAMKLPVVSSNCDGVLDIVVHEQTGLLVPPRAVAELTAAVSQLISDRAQRLSLGAAGYDRVVQYFSEDQMLQQFNELHAKLVALNS